MEWAALAAALGVGFSITAGSVLVLWVLSIIRGDVSTIDTVFSVIVVAGVAVAGGVIGAAPTIRKISILAPLAVWSLRLTAYVGWRKWGEGEDPRYTRLRSWTAPGWPFHRFALRQVFGLQGVALFLLSLPPIISLTASEPRHLGPFAYVGGMVWLVGFFFEAVGDWQLVRFRSDPGNRGRVLDSGLWRYTRHPNYFGELTMAWGIFATSLQVPWAALGVVGPAFYTRLVLQVTGTPTLEKKLTREKPGYTEYVARTSPFWPRRPAGT